MLRNNFSHYFKNFIICSVYYLIFGIAVGNIIALIMNRSITLEYFIVGSSGIIYYIFYETFSANKYIESEIDVSSSNYKILLDILNKHMKYKMSSLETGIFPLNLFKYPYHLKMEIVISGDIIKLRGPKKMMRSMEFEYESLNR